jgi:hypothetical protein
MHAFAHRLLPEHDVFPQPTADDRLGLALLTGSLIVASAWLGPNELVILSWAWLGGWSTLKVLARRRERDRETMDEGESM